MHLHVASSFSLRYGVAPPRVLAARAAELGMETLALTDRDGVYGAVKHVRACRAAGLRPVLGADLDTGSGRVVVLATGRTGWGSLCRLVTAAHRAGERGGPVASRELVGKLQPRTIGDLVIDISLFRPGPVNSDMVTPFLDARHGRREPAYPHPDLVGPLRESQGVVVFHEQVLRVLAGCGLSDAEAVRRSLADEEGQAQAGAWFRERALARGYSEETVATVWRTLTAFGAFGFCKAHAASFALPTYQSAWLKRHHPAAFYAGVLTHDPGMYPKRVILDDARHFGVPVLPLDVNRSAASWQAEPAPGGARGIRVALAEVRGISEAEIERIVAGRPYRSLTDFWHRTRVSRPIAERLVLAGGFDALYGIGDLPGDPTVPTRRDLLCGVGALERSSVRPGAKMIEGQLALDDATDDFTDEATDPGASGAPERIPVGELPPMTSGEMVEAELEILGMDVSRHVLTFYDALRRAMAPARRDGPARPVARRVLYANGFAMSPYSDIGHAGEAVKRPPARLWHASGGSSGPTP